MVGYGAPDPAAIACDLMPDEAKLEQAESGLKPASDGWFVVNVGDAAWYEHEAFGSGASFESREFPFKELGININVLSGDQCMTVFKNVAQEADAASKLAIALAKGGKAGADALATTTLKDTKANRDIKYVALVPTAITKANIKDVITAGAVTKADLCKGVEALCTAAGI
mgnify:CR=1 FL=1